ncbi:RDD family protein [Flavobacterium sp. '19STA2R22 D10 B1']|uniref:RDD family protein n=1 Tax=Flavobacterium aerium TaxID=3037261 RepID=UPI00278BB7D9|nr:RDD family protein [Flavobacterium sp. '19STA2R22 D10 B1']
MSIEDSVKSTEANKGTRAINMVIDYTVLMLLLFVLLFGIVFIIAIINPDYATAILGFVENTGDMADYIFGIPVAFLYYMIFETLTSRSIGKYITGTKVVMEDGSKPTKTAVFYRTVSRCIPFETLTFLLSARGWHDSISKTYVVNAKEFESKRKFNEEFHEIGIEKQN